jgi:prepilin peptidase CpaA
MIGQFVDFVVIPALIVVAGFCDLTRYTIPNPLPAALALAYFAVAMASGAGWLGFGMHVATGIAALAAGFVMFTLRWIGGGDAKLFAATALILGPSLALDYTLLAALFGGAMAVALLAMRQLPLPAPLSTQGWLVRLHDAREGIPYGVALALAALVVIFRSNFVHFVVS